MNADTRHYESTVPLPAFFLSVLSNSFTRPGGVNTFMPTIPLKGTFASCEDAMKGFLWKYLSRVSVVYYNNAPFKLVPENLAPRTSLSLYM